MVIIQLTATLDHEGDTRTIDRIIPHISEVDTEEAPAPPQAAATEQEGRFIRNCPFCKGVSKVLDLGQAARYFKLPTKVVECDKCGARSKAYRNEEKAIKAWNKRV